ncbi:F-box/LRR-repeat protein 15 [Henckelia pumila]|uniref:F-box/LRR-repeat protein 15 n=1 Tax=Henckelia pumila TaxID=405737 RepID=UPI003C6E2234
MKIWCFPFKCFGVEDEEDNQIDAATNTIYFFGVEKGTGPMKENWNEQMANDDSELGFWPPLGNVGDGDEGEGLGLGLRVTDAIGRENNGMLHLEGDIGERGEDFFKWVNDMESRYTSSGGIGSQVDVNLKLGFNGEPSSSSSSAADMGTEKYNRDLPNKRPKFHSFALDWDSNLGNEMHYLAPVHENVGDENLYDLSGASENAANDLDPLKMDYLEVRMDLTDDLLHMVFSFLDQIDLCRAAMVCRQWKDASSHEDFWRYLNFENQFISLQHFEKMCQRYPNATAVNVYGTPAIHSLAMKAISSLRNLEILTLGKGQLGETFFQALTDCHMLRSLTVNDTTLGNGIQEIPLYHDTLLDLQIVKCRVLRVSIRCPLLETLSLKRSSMPQAVLNCPLLRQLDIASCHKLSDAAIRSAATSCPLLESLDMSNCSSVSDETILEISRSCGNLHILDASYCPNISLESVRLTMLTVLKLHSCEGVTSASMAAISDCHMLEVLELDNCSLLTSVSLDLLRLQTIRLVHCRKLVDLNLRSSVLSSITVSNCPSLQRISITSKALKKLVLQKQESLTSLVLECPCLQDVDLTECESLTNSICEVFSSGGGCPMLRSLVLDSCESLTAVSFYSTSLISLSLGGCRSITSLELRCPCLEHVSLDGCDHLERASFSPVGLRSLNLGICPKLNVLCIGATHMVSLELKGCGVLSEALINCPLLTCLDASFCSQLEDDCLSATASSCPLIESLILMSCPSVGPDGLLSLRRLLNLTYLDLSYTFLVNLQPVFDSCLYLKVLKLQACKYLDNSSLEPLYKGNALPALCELDLSYGTLCQSAIEELLACCTHLTHISMNGCVNMHDLDWGFHSDKRSVVDTLYGSFETHSENAPFQKDQTNRLLQNLNCVGCPNIRKVVIPPAAGCFHLSLLNLSLSSNLKEVDLSCCNLFFLNLSNCNSLEILKLDCPRLTSLFLQSCNIDEEAVEAAIKQCIMLETLDVRFCSKISSSSMGTFRAACPSLKRIFSSLATM